MLTQNVTGQGSMLTVVLIGPRPVKKSKNGLGPVKKNVPHIFEINGNEIHKKNVVCGQCNVAMFFSKKNL